MFRNSTNIIRNFVIIAVVLSLSFAAVQSAKADYATPHYEDEAGRLPVIVPLAGCASAIVARIVTSDALWTLLFKVIKPQDNDPAAVFIPGPQLISVTEACR